MKRCSCFSMRKSQLLRWLLILGSAFLLGYLGAVAYNVSHHLYEGEMAYVVVPPHPDENGVKGCP